MEDNMVSVSELPYFEGDFWPNILEESIKELDQEEEEQKKAVAAQEAANTVRIILFFRIPYTYYNHL
jgi:Histone acetylation protein.